MWSLERIVRFFPCRLNALVKSYHLWFVRKWPWWLACLQLHQGERFFSKGNVEQPTETYLREGWSLYLDPDDEVYDTLKSLRIKTDSISFLALSGVGSLTVVNIRCTNSIPWKKLCTQGCALQRFFTDLPQLSIINNCTNDNAFMMSYLTWSESLSRFAQCCSFLFSNWDTNTRAYIHLFSCIFVLWYFW